MGWVLNVTPRPLYPLERPGTRCIGGWVGLRAGLDRRRKSRRHRDSIPEPVQPVASRYTNWAIPAHTVKQYLALSYHDSLILFSVFLSWHTTYRAQNYNWKRKIFFHGWLIIQHERFWRSGVFRLWSFVWECRIAFYVEKGTSEECVQTEVQGIPTLWIACKAASLLHGRREVANYFKNYASVYRTIAWDSLQ